MFATEYEVTGLIAALVVAVQPDVVIETGTYTGQTSAAIGSALAAAGHGHLFTTETDPVHADLALTACDGLPVTVIPGSLGDWLAAGAPPAPAQLVFLDSAVGQRPAELRALAPHLADGCLVCVHDTGPQHGMNLGPVLDELGMESVTLRTPRGLTIAQVRREW